ncbi:MAG: FHA domain-containing protein [Thaumarchaeota archaeon]|jgi:hypothetical protein|nr:FHA domain-containing protein [Nitrososphaerota archaeon]
MDKCPQCNSNRIPDENFCDSCGHKYAAPSKSETPKVESNSESKSFDDYEKDYLERLEGKSSESEVNTSEVNTSEVNTSEQTGGAVWIPNVSGNEQPIYFEFEQKTIGRMDVSEYLKSQNIDQLQVSRKQFTFYTEDGKFYIVDGKTSVQEKPSGNHTTVNGKDITEQGPIELHTNDVIGMSTVLNITFKIS